MKNKLDEEEEEDEEDEKKWMMRWRWISSILEDLRFIQIKFYPTLVVTSTAFYPSFFPLVSCTVSLLLVDFTIYVSNSEDGGKFFTV